MHSFVRSLLLAMLFFEFQPQSALSAGMRPDDFAVRVFEHFRHFVVVNCQCGFAFTTGVMTPDKSDWLIADSAFHDVFYSGKETVHNRGELYPTLTCCRAKLVGAGSGTSSGSDRHTTSSRRPSVSFCNSTSCPLPKRIASR